MKKKLMAVIMTGALCAGMAFPTMADTSGGAIPALNGADVFAGVTLADPDAKVKVEVPTLFAFVVHGSVGENLGKAESAITNPTGDKSILLPNIKVTGTTGNYALETVSGGNWKFVNYSTEASTAADAVDNRSGLAVNITGSIKNEGSAADRNGWTHVANAKDLGVGNAKKYTLAVDDKKFSTVEADGSYKMASEMVLAAPDLSVGGVDAVTRYANVGNAVDATFNVYVGGNRGEYNTVEQSAKVGTIVWTIRVPVATTTP